MKYVSRLLKWSALCLIFGVIGIVLARIAIANYYPGGMTSYYVSEAHRDLYQTGARPMVYRQDLRFSYDDNDFAKFMAGSQYYCPSLGELQITVRYNDATLREVQADYALSEVPEATADLFDYSLMDDNGNRSPLMYKDTDRKFMYNYLKLCFSGVTFDEETNWIRLEIYYKDDLDYTEEPYACILVWEKGLVPSDGEYRPTEQEVGA